MDQPGQDAHDLEGRTAPPTLFRLQDAIAAGYTRSQLRGAGWRAVSHGVYDRARPDDRQAARYEDVAPVLPPKAMAAHLTAARHYGLWLPRLPAWLPVLANQQPGTERPERAGLYVFRSRAALPPYRIVAGIPCVPPEVCIGQLAEDLTLVDLVVALDSALGQHLCSVDEVLAAIRHRQRGLPRLREAITLCDGRSESPWETVLRLLHVVCGIPVDPQSRLRADDGEVLARGDLRIRGTRRFAEYDGAEHRRRERHRSDLAREKLLQRHGFERYGYTASEIVADPATIVRDAEVALGWEHRRDRIEPWWPLADTSSLTQTGRRLLARRLARFARPLRGRGDRRIRGRGPSSAPHSPGLRETG